MLKRGGELETSSHIKDKKTKLELDDDDGQVQIGRVNNIEVLNMKVLEYQNQRLVENNEARRMFEEELKKRVDNLEERHSADESVISIVNQYWNQLDEDVRLLVERFDYDNLGLVDNEDRPALNSFLTTLASWDHTEAEQLLRNRVEFSKRAIGKLISAYDRNVYRNHKLWKLIISDDTELDKILRDTGKVMDNHTSLDYKESDIKFKVSAERISSLNKATKDELSIALKENKSLQDKIMNLHENNHELSTKNKHYEDNKIAAETVSAELRNKIDDFEHDYMITQQKCIKMENNYKALRRLKMTTKDSGADDTNNKPGGSATGDAITRNKYQEINVNMGIDKDLALNRLAELEKLQLDYQASLKSNELLKMDLATLPESVITESIDYRCLKSHFSVLYTESTQMKVAHDEAFAMIREMKLNHQRQVDQMEMAELDVQKEFRMEIIQLEDQLSQLKREYQMLRVEFEQTLANNEKSAPINSEMRSLILSLKKHNDQIKNELIRYRKKTQDFENDISRIKFKLLYSDEDEIISSLRHEQKLLEQKVKDLQITLESYKSCSKEARDIAEIINSEKKAIAEVEDLKSHLIIYKSHDQEIEKIDFPKTEVKILDLQSSLALQKQEEGTLINEMEVTGQAFEEMQEQNIKLMTQIREKDDAHFKLMSERIKSNQVHGILREEKDALNDALTSLRYQVKNQNDIVQGLEERESTLMIGVTLAERELTNHQQATDVFKRKAIESSQSAADLKLHLAKYHDQLKQSQKVVMEKTQALQQETFRYKRIQEEFGMLRKKYDRIKKMETASVDDVLMEEIKEYKEQLMCQCCKVARKDAVLTKCYHVFCLNCLRTRYETRQRKCPKCNATFGAKDFHRIYLES